MPRRQKYISGSLVQGQVHWLQPGFGGVLWQAIDFIDTGRQSKCMPLSDRNEPSWQVVSEGLIRRSSIVLFLQMHNSKSGILLSSSRSLLPSMAYSPAQNKAFNILNHSTVLNFVKSHNFMREPYIKSRLIR